jgi:hypothetical protein
MRKAVAPMISTLIMLAIVVAFGSGIMLWSNKSLNTFSISQGLFLQQGSDAVKERLVVEFVQFNSTAPKSVNVYVRNVGQSHMNIDTIAIVELSQASSANIAQPTNKDIDCDYSVCMGEATKFTFQYNFNTGQVYKITVMTTNGNKVIAHATA